MSSLQEDFKPCYYIIQIWLFIKGGCVWKQHLWLRGWLPMAGGGDSWTLVEEWWNNMQWEPILRGTGHFFPRNLDVQAILS